MRVSFQDYGSGLPDSAFTLSGLKGLGLCRSGMYRLWPYFGGVRLGWFEVYAVFMLGFEFRVQVWVFFPGTGLGRWILGN